MKKKIIILISLLSMCFFIGIGFAAFNFINEVISTAESGHIELINKSFITYTSSTNNGVYEVNRDNYSVVDARVNSMITCNATRKNGYDEEEEYHLNQLGFSFSFNTDIAVYLRIHFEDAWISVKTYNNGTEVRRYITKGEIDGVSPFAVLSSNTNWVYDEATNYLYYKDIIKTDTGIGNTTANNNTKVISFDINENYFYNVVANPAYRETILVEVSFYVDIVQANRAEAKWQVDLDQIFNK